MATEQGAHVADIYNVDVVVGSVPTLGVLGSKRLGRLDPEAFKCIIIDEAHHAAAATYGRILQHFGAHEPTSPVLVRVCMHGTL